VSQQYQQVVWLVPERSNTYCMRELGHTGKCNPYGKGPPPKEKEK
jgi:hypothetical protein